MPEANNNPSSETRADGSGGGSAKPWGGRFGEGQAPLFERLNASIPYDHVLAPYDIRGSRAHVDMLVRIGVLSREDTEVLLDGLDQVQAEVESGKFAWRLEDEDVHMAVERRLTEIVGAVGGRLHTARSRNDQVALDVQLYLRDAVLGHLRRLNDLCEALLGRAEAEAGVVLPGYTHLQRAQPVLLAHHLLAHVAAFERDAERLLRWHEAGSMPLGAGALAGVSYRVDRDYVAGRLGFSRTAWNAMDAVASRDWALEYQAGATICALNLSRLAEELVLWSSQEFGFVRLPDAWTSGSSIMPQKRNPDAAELVRGKSAGFVGRFTALATLVKALPLAYNKDLQEDKLYLFATREELDLCLEAATAMIEAMAVDGSATRLAAEGGYAQATDVADLLVERGLPFREAHRVAGRLVAVAAEKGVSLGELTREELADVSDLLDEDYYQVVELDRVVGTKISPGGTAPERVEEQLAVARERLSALARRAESLSASGEGTTRE